MGGQPISCRTTASSLVIAILAFANSTNAFATRFTPTASSRHTSGCIQPLDNLYIPGCRTLQWKGENVQPSSREYDYQDAAPAGRLRAIVNGRQLGAVPTLMTQADAYPNNPNHPFLMRQLVGWLLAHDCLPRYVEFWSALASEMEMWRDADFIGYWRHDPRLCPGTEGVIVSAHVRTGHAVLWINNMRRQDLVAKVQVDLAGLGLDPAKTVAFDAETGEAVAVANGRFSIPVESRLWRAVRFQAINRLGPGGDVFRIVRWT